MLLNNFRIWQMDITRRLSEGRLAEILGELPLTTDIITRTMGFTRKAREDLKKISQAEAQALEAYTSGINAYLHSSWFELPVEYSLIGEHQIEDWKLLDTLTVSRCLFWQMQKGWGHELVRQMLVETLGDERSLELEPTHLKHMPHHLYFAGADPYPRSLSPKQQKKLEDSMYFQYEGGSNAWVISGNKTKSGKPILR
jgi:penicillin amidase